MIDCYSNISDSVQSSDEIESNSSNLIATTDAAIRIASDIIDSTLAHADDHGEYRNRNGDRAPNPSTYSSVSMMG